MAGTRCHAGNQLRIRVLSFSNRYLGTWQGPGIGGGGGGLSTTMYCDPPPHLLASKQRCLKPPKDVPCQAGQSKWPQGSLRSADWPFRNRRRAAGAAASSQGKTTLINLNWPVRYNNLNCDFRLSRRPQKANKHAFERPCRGGHGKHPWCSPRAIQRAL